MKLTILTAFVGLALCASTPVRADPNDAAPDVATPKESLRVTLDNFVSFSWQQTGGFAGITTRTEIQGHILTNSSPRRGEGEDKANAPRNLTLSNNQLKRLVEELDKSNFTAITGNYRQQGLFDGFAETAILTLSDENDQDKQFVIHNYGFEAPKGYLDFTAFFRGFVDMKSKPIMAPLLPATTTNPK